MRCKICSSDKAQFYTNLNAFQIYLCKLCKTFFAYPMPGSKYIKDMYSQNYYDAWKGTQTGLTKQLKLMKLHTFGRYLDLVEKYTPLRGKRIIDVGCAMGWLLEEAGQRGASCWGVEISSYAADIARKKFGGSISLGTLKDAKHSSEAFDFVIMIDSLEHTPDPAETLKETRRILKPGGLVFVVTPNNQSLYAKVLGKQWTNFKEEHLFLFSPKSISILAKKAGLTIIYQAPAKKTLTPDYIYSHLNVYKKPTFIFYLTRLVPLLPERLKQLSFLVKTDEHVFLLRK